MGWWVAAEMTLCLLNVMGYGDAQGKGESCIG